MSLNFYRKIIEIFPINKQILVFCLFFAVFSAFWAPAQTKHQRYIEYIERYKGVALQHEREFGVPFLSAVQDYPEMGRRLYDALKNHPEPEPVRDFVPCRLIG